jgi:ABC-type dipeptide/oligopeptide/nickel transport system permease component
MNHKHLTSVLPRLGWGLATLFGASVVAFVLLRVLPGNPAQLAAGPLASRQAIQAEAHALGLDQSLPIQYVHFVHGFATGNWGYAYSVGEPARQEIMSRLPASLELACLAFLIAITAAVLLAVLAVYTQRPAVDRVCRGLSSIGLATPQFWLALVLLAVFSEKLHLAPGPVGRLSPGVQPPPHTTGFYVIDALIHGQPGTALNAFDHLLMPAIVLSVVPAAFLLRLLRGNLLEASREPFMLVMKAKGASRWSRFIRHAFPNAALPAITAAGLILAEMLAGAVLVEKAFGWPGVGTLVVNSILNKDFAVVQSVIVLSAIAYVVINTTVDVLYRLIDPRIGSADR